LKRPPTFGEWSDERYGWSGVSDILLQCQNTLELNVNILLWCAWCAEYFAEAPELPLRKAMQLTEPWSREVTQHIRFARRALKEPLAQADAEAALALRKDLLAAELKSERIEQAMLSNLAHSTLTPFHDANSALPRAKANCARYAALAGAVRRQGFSTLLLDDLAARIFPYADHAKRLQA
jgi:uncharacterized protein (TIGR02444 family)